MDKPILEFTGDFAFLSNFFVPDARIRYDGDTYPTLEHAYQAAKLADRKMRTPFQDAGLRPGQAKRLGAGLLLRPNWDTLKDGIMTELVRDKFLQPRLQRLLLATNSSLLFEGNRWRDLYWGIDLHSGKGQNRLGIILMALRKELYDATTEKH